jgi:uncharacterized protein Veg
VLALPSTAAVEFETGEPLEIRSQSSVKRRKGQSLVVKAQWPRSRHRSKPLAMSQTYASYFKLKLNHPTKTKPTLKPELHNIRRCQVQVRKGRP